MASGPDGFPADLAGRFIIAIIFLSIIHPRFKKPVSLREELLFLAIGTALASYFVFENSALQWTYSSNVSLIVATIPFMTGILSRLVYKTPFFTLHGVIGLVMAYLGVLIIIINGSQLEGVEPIGDLLAIGAAVMFAIYSVFMLKTGSAYTLIQLTRKVFVYGLVALSLMLAVIREPVIPESLTGQGFASLFYLGIVASSLAFIFWNRAIQAIGPVKTNQYIYLIPVMTTLFAAILLQEPVTWLTIAGAAMILAGLYLSEKSRSKT
jgi:drug/metabolite transporter (DMT)-like permease